MYLTIYILTCCFLAFDFCRFSVIIRLVHPGHNGQWPPTLKDFYPRFYPLHFLSYIYSSERASIVCLYIYFFTFLFLSFLVHALIVIWPWAMYEWCRNKFLYCSVLHYTMLIVSNMHFVRIEYIFIIAWELNGKLS